MDPEILSIPGYPGQSGVVPPDVESHGSCYTKYLDILGTVPGSQFHQAWSLMDPEILSIPGYPGQLQVEPPGMDSRGS